MQISTVGAARRLVFAACGAVLAGCASGGVQRAEVVGDVTTVLVVRHAERASTEANSDLSAEGRSRAAALVTLGRELGAEAVYSTEFCRTAQTADPLAIALDLPLHVAPVGSRAGGLDGCSPAIRAQRLMVDGAASADALAAHLLERWRGRTVVVVGHSNTVPALVTALSGTSPCGSVLPASQGACNLDESEYHHAFVVRVGTGGADIEHRTLGRER